MKKAILAMVFAATIFSGTSITTQAEEKLDLAEVVYPANAQKTEYYSLKLLTYGTNYKKFAAGANNFDHVKLTNDKVYTTLDYANTYVAAKREGDKNILARGLAKLVNEKTARSLTIKQGKFENGRVVAAEVTPTEPEVREFKVVDIK